jgi:xanthine dehydrogenase molybdopterin-binding subunit B
MCLFIQVGISKEGKLVAIVADLYCNAGFGSDVSMIVRLLYNHYH